MEKQKRKSLTKKVRFEVFKRDSFTCQYCGRTAPSVILEVDHIKPVCDGGQNEKDFQQVKKIAASSGTWTEFKVDFNYWCRGDY